MSIQKILSASLLLAGMGAAAQQPIQAPRGWQASASLPVALEGLHSVTGKRLAGFCLEGAYQGSFPESDAGWRAGLGVQLFPGTAVDGLTRSLMNQQVFLDGIKPLGLRTSLVFGLSLNAWQKKVEGTDRWGQSNEISKRVDHSYGKVGFRLGVEVTLSGNWSAEALLQVSELGTDNEFLDGGAADLGRTAVNPSWIQVGVRHRF